VLDLSNTEFLLVQTEDGRQIRIAWEAIKALDFEERLLSTSSEQKMLRAGTHRMTLFPIGKKLV
jgi:hypothetical protein